VFMHIFYGVVHQDDIVDENWGIDIGIEIIQANVNKEHPSNCCIPFFQWKQLSPEAQHVWESIPDVDKHVILHSATSRPTVCLLNNTPHCKWFTIMNWLPIMNLMQTVKL
jgi:hypothetical protein